MTQDLVPIASSPPPALAGVGYVPALFAAAGERAVRRFLEFFTANIRNKNTRTAYAQAVWRFSAWCESHRFALEQLTPVLVATYIEELGQELPSRRSSSTWRRCACFSTAW